MQEGRKAGAHGGRRLEPITSLENVRFAWLCASQKCQGGSACRPLRPEFFDFVISLFERRDSRTPVRENGGHLGRTALFARDRQDFAHIFWQWVGLSILVSSCGDAEATQVIIHQIVAVPTAMILRELEQQDGAAGKADVGGALENGFARLIAAPWAGINAPRRLFVIIYGELYGAG